MQTRRETLKQSALVAGLLASTGLFPQYAHAAFNKTAFEAKNLADALKALGASDADAHRVAANSRSWWRNSAGQLNRVLTIAYFDRWGVPRLS